MEHNPDRWLVLKITNGDDALYKVFGTWLGGYLDGDSWRMNSGITSIGEDGDYWLFRGASGSVYRCHKEGIGASGYTSAVLNGMMKRAQNEGFTIEVVEDVDLILL